MDTWAFAASAAALIVSIWSAVNSHRSAAHAKRSSDAAEEVAGIDRERRHDECTPTFHMSFMPVASTDNRQGLLTLVNEGPQDLDSVRLELTGMPSGLVGFCNGTVAVEGGSICLGQSLVFEMVGEDRPRGRSGEFRARVTARSGQSEWTNMLTCPPGGDVFSADYWKK